jgi:phage portal protein BeeE
MAQGRTIRHPAHNDELPQQAAPCGRLPAGESRGTNLEFKPDLDQIEALAAERDALWKRLEAASFLTDDEKRAAAGYGAMSNDPPPSQK